MMTKFSDNTNRPEEQEESENTGSIADYQIMTNMVTFLILMRIDRAEGSQSYLEKSRALVLKALSH